MRSTCKEQSKEPRIITKKKTKLSTCSFCRRVLHNRIAEIDNAFAYNSIASQTVSKLNSSCAKTQKRATFKNRSTSPVLVSKSKSQNHCICASNSLLSNKSQYEKDDVLCERSPNPSEYTNEGQNATDKTLCKCSSHLSEPIKEVQNTTDKFLCECSPNPSECTNEGQNSTDKTLCECSSYLSEPIKEVRNTTDKFLCECSTSQAEQENLTSSLEQRRKKCFCRSNKVSKRFPRSGKNTKPTINTKFLQTCQHYSKEGQYVECDCLSDENISLSTSSSEYLIPTKKWSCTNIDRRFTESQKTKNFRLTRNGQSSACKRISHRCYCKYTTNASSKLHKKTKATHASLVTKFRNISMLPKSSDNNAVSTRSSMMDSVNTLKTTLIALEFDPYKHRNVEKPTNNITTLLHIIKSVIGTGILAMPQAYVNSGCLTGVIMTVVIGSLLTHCMNTMFRVQYILCKRRQVPFLTYSQSVTVALEEGPRCLRPIAKFVGVMATTLTIMLQLGVSCCYVVFIAGTLKRIVDPYRHLRIEYHMSFVTLPLIFSNMIKSLKVLAPYSLAANVVGLGALFGTAILIIQEPPISKEPVDMYGSIHSFPLFFGTLLFSLTSVGAIISIERNMKTPEAFVTGWTGVLNISMAFVIFFYLVIGIVGYLHCKSKCMGNITLSLPVSVIMRILWALYAMSMFVGYALQCFFPLETIWEVFFKERFQKASEVKIRFWQSLLRFTVTVFTVLCAIASRKLGLIVSFLSIAIVAIIVPAVMEFCVALSFKFAMTKYIIVFKDILLFCIGTTMLIVFISITIFH